MLARRRTFLGLCFVVASLALIGCLAFLPLPFATIAFVWSSLALLAARRARRRAHGAALTALAAAILACGLAEMVFWRIEARRALNSWTLSPDFRVADDLLGVVPRSDSAFRAQRHRGEELVYDVTYSIGQDGLRITGPQGGHPAGPSVLFFGGSYTFGEGVEDEESLPYQVQTFAGNAVHTHNFGFSGYGPHHMLAALEAGRVRDLLACSPVVAVYMAIPDHVRRAAGKTTFGRGSPRYELTPSGILLRAGSLGGTSVNPPGDSSGWLDRLGWRLRGQLRKSWLLQWLSRRPRALEEADVQLFLRIVAAARTRVEQDYPGCLFHVLLWYVQSDELGLHDALRSQLAAEGIPVHLVADILPGYREDSSPYELSPYDRHPNAHAYRLLAEHVVRSILKR